MQHHSGIMPDISCTKQGSIASAWAHLAISALTPCYWVNTGHDMLYCRTMLTADILSSCLAIHFGAVCSASDAVAEVAGSVRENIKLRRGFRY